MDSIDEQALKIPAEERPVPASRLSGFSDFLGIYGGEHIAATEFVIGALLVTWGVRAGELILGLVVGNLLAASSYALVTAPIAVDTRLSLFAYLRKVTGPWFQRVFNATWGIISIVWAASMMAISVSSLKEAIGLPIQTQWYPTSGACVALTLALVAVTVLVSAFGFKGVVKFSSLCVPWMVTIFFCGAAVGVPMLAKATDFGAVNGLGGFFSLIDTRIFNGTVPPGVTRLTWIHVAAFAWMCGFVYHVGLNDMSIFRFAKRASYGWVGLFGMYLGHFFAWICAGVMGAAAAAVLKVGLHELDSGAVTAAVLGWSGLFAVVVAGWTTANPNIYRAALSFATLVPKAPFRTLVFGVGAVIALAACFPGVMRIDMIANAAALLVPQVGAICLMEHWIFPKIGFTRYWNLYLGKKINPAALGAWVLSSLFALLGATLGWMHPFFLPMPTFALAGLAYLVLAAILGARHPVPAERRAHVDAIERRVAELAETDEREESAKAGPKGHAAARALRVLAYLALAALVIEAIFNPTRFRLTAIVCTALYFLAALAAECLTSRKGKI